MLTVPVLVTIHYDAALDSLCSAVSNDLACLDFERLTHVTGLVTDLCSLPRGFASTGGDSYGFLTMLRSCLKILDLLQGSIDCSNSARRNLQLCIGYRTLEPLRRFLTSSNQYGLFNLVMLKRIVNR
jgi:hypothetical protein